MPSLYDTIIARANAVGIPAAAPPKKVGGGYEVGTNASMMQLLKQVEAAEKAGTGTTTGGTVSGAGGSIVPIQAPTPVKTDPFQYTLDNASKIQSIAELVNNINQKAQQAANAGRIPGGGDLEAKSSQNISQALSGVVPSDVLYQIGQQAAQRGAMSGSPLGASTNADYLRALGLTSLNLQNQGQSWLTAATGRNPAAPIYDTGSLVMTPQQQGALDNAAQSLAQQLYLGQLDDNTKRWIAQLDADTRVKLLTLAENYRQNGIGPKPWKSYGANWQPWMATSGGTGAAKPETPATKPNYSDWFKTDPGATAVPYYPRPPSPINPGMNFPAGDDVVNPGMNYDPDALGELGIGISDDQLNQLYNQYAGMLGY